MLQEWSTYDDLWSFGLVLYFMFYQQEPWKDEIGVIDKQKLIILNENVENVFD